MQDQARRAEQRRAEMRTALGSLAPLTAIPVRLSADFVSLDPGVTQVVVSGSVDVATLPFVRRQRPPPGDGRDRGARLRRGGSGRRDAGDRADDDGPDRRGLRAASAARPSVPPDGRAPSPAGTRCASRSREDATGLLGSAWRWVEIPDLAAGRLTLSSLFLLKDDGPSGAPGGPDDAPALRSVQDRPRFGRTESLYVQLYAYNAKRDAAGAIDLVVAGRGPAEAARCSPRPRRSR